MPSRRLDFGLLRTEHWLGSCRRKRKNRRCRFPRLASGLLKEFQHGFLGHSLSFPKSFSDAMGFHLVCFREGIVHWGTGPCRWDLDDSELWQTMAVPVGFGFRDGEPSAGTLNCVSVSSICPVSSVLPSVSGGIASELWDLSSGFGGVARQLLTAMTLNLEEAGPCPTLAQSISQQARNREEQLQKGYVIVHAFERAAQQLKALGPTL